MGLRVKGGGAEDWMGGKGGATVVGRTGVEKPSGAKLEMPVVLGRVSGLDRPRRQK